jgi:hypothetical protein
VGATTPISFSYGESLSAEERMDCFEGAKAAAPAIREATMASFILILYQQLPNKKCDIFSLLFHRHVEAKRNKSFSDVVQ